ncbi:uncharacterized protein [Henckelia pumila]|uniref:uncharacterized protein n=1 Tax=Henckelia pumila TaxID=405737 RepID=UPI003C6E2F37
MVVTISQSEEPEKRDGEKNLERPKSSEIKKFARSENSSTADALAQMPNYARFLKDLLKNKKKMNDLAQATMNEECSAMLQNRLPPKSQDPGSFSIPCNIGQFSIDNALCDLGTSINLMPYSLAKKLGIGVTEPTLISLKLADRSVKYPRGVVENVLVKVEKLIFHVDFVVLDIDEDFEVPMILGRPFLATSRALIDIEKGELVLRMNDKQVVFNMLKSVRNNPIVKSFFAIDVVDICVGKLLQGNDNHDIVLQHHDQESPAKGVEGCRDSTGHTTTIVDYPP